MGEGITGSPNTYDFGLEFDYSVWTPGTQVDLVNVPWNNDYRDVVRFTNKAALNAYIDSRKPAGLSFDKLSYVKPNTPITLPITHSRAVKYNYVRVSNPLQPVQGGDEIKYYYYFILDVVYDSPQASRLVLQLDVWQTFVYDVTFGRCFVERGHIGIANSNQFSNYGRDYLTVPEGLDLGSDYRVIAKRTEEIVSNGVGTLFQESDILIFSTTDLSQDPGTKDDPNLNTAPGSQVNGLPSAAGAYVFPSITGFRGWLDGMKEYPWITQGIISVTAIPKMTRYDPTFTYGANEFTPKLVNSAFAPIIRNMFNDWRNSPEIINAIPARYRSLKKFLTAPYMMLEMTTWSASPVALRPESWNDANAQIMERANLIPPAQRIQFIPRKYNSNGQTPEPYFGLSQAEFQSIVNALPAGDRATFAAKYGQLGDDYGDYLDVMTQISNLPSFPVVNNMAISYLASNHSTISYQRRSADWSQQRALAGAQAQYDIATGAIGMNVDMTRNTQMADALLTGNTNRTHAAQATVNAINQGVSGVGMALTPGGFGGAAIAGVAGAAATGVNAGIQTAANDEALAIRQYQAQNNMLAQNRQMGLARDTNNDLARFAARGDYANTIAGINAKVQDAEMIQPSMSAQYGGDAANLAFGTMEFSIRWKLIDNAAIRRIGEFWFRFGYAVAATILLPANLHVMTKFTYWKCQETYIQSAQVPEGYKQVIRGILEKGVTVWVNPADIGVVDWADNQPLSGVSY